MKKLNITSLDHIGRGIGKIDNKVIFVENALPGEIITYKIKKERKNFFEGYSLEIIKESKERIKAICPYYNNCGGCNLMHTNYNNQVKYKEDKIKNIINKYLNNNIKINDIVKSDIFFNYRNKITFQVKEKIGFYNKRSNNIVYVDNCLLANDKINNLIPYLNKLDLNNIKNITCRTNDIDLMIIISVKNKIDTDDIINMLKNVCTSIIINYNGKFECIYGNNFIINKIGNLKYYVTNDGFFQINNNVTYKMYSKIKDYCNLRGNETILDLYCGSGTIGLFLSENCKKVIGVEINKSSILCANENKKLNNINNCEFICNSTDNIKLKNKFDIIIVDPPRSGLSKKTINDIIKSNVSKIIYTSCDPMTLTRDLNILKDYYNIIEITPFDMFPNTHHVECVCLLQKL